jgi:hypothetical protein
MSDQHTLNRYQTVKEFVATRSWPTASSIRYYIFYNVFGFEAQCVRRLGRKVLIDTQAFESWIEEQSSNEVSHV